MLENTVVFTLLAVVVTALLSWRIKTSEFRRIPWFHFCIAAALFWGVFSLILILVGWEFYYSQFAPHNFRYIIPIVAIIVYPLWSLIIRWIAVRSPYYPVLVFCILGGIQGTIEHVIAIYRMDILSVPFLASSTAMAVMIFAFFEYVVYWGIVVIIAKVIGRFLVRLKGKGPGD